MNLVLDVALAKRSLYCLEELIELLFFGDGFPKGSLLVVVHQGVPLVDEEQEANLSMRVHFQNLFNRCEVLEGLRHLFTCNVKMACMPKIVDPVIAVIVSLGLSNFVVVMREL